MAEPTLADLLAEMKTMAAEMMVLKADVASVKEKTVSSSSSGDGRPGGLHEQDFHPKHKKWDFPRFDGTTDPLLFINKCDAYFRQHRTPVEDRVAMASYHLDDVAQLWFIQLQADDGTPNWTHFKDLLHLRFGPPLRSAPMFELAECRRTDTVDEYSNRFQALLPRAGRLEEEQRVQLYTGGLLPPLSHAVRLHNPATLAEAMSLARQVELMELSRPAPPPPARAPPRGLLPTPAPRLALPAPQPPLALPAPPAAAQQGKAEGPHRRLSPAEMADRRRQGLCFNCNEPYARGHNRFCKRLFFVDGVEIDAADAPPAAADTAEADPGTEAPCYSLHAVAGVPVSDTIQIKVSVGSASLLALLDSGSTHSFISEDAARLTGLPIQDHPRLTATVANGERVACPGVIRNAPFSINGTAFSTDLFVMPLAGYEVVLGTCWMRTLGDVVWNFAERTMSFHSDGRHITWAGLPSSSVTSLRTIAAASGTLLDELLAAYADIFAAPSGLPPPRTRDHAIVLKPGSAPVAVRPYRYPAAHKDELERQCAAMMEQGVVRRSDSPFSSPALLVQKALQHVNTWAI
ncbi:uncharacterized protein LOC110433726 [Sorghum bicolor]|uniref:uncharacterized protein LOC110433726 n=1 Tax=Sorghum bicolor TaxID=4558 RepID=UPI000B423EF3|nr:uncharacterized protein LOC110433726 [Sorghum bicolor]|eukprot:XP_021311923.1 uncharacterized protein LOC110433726 [Sorghum bicolor]